MIKRASAILLISALCLGGVAPPASADGAGFDVSDFSQDSATPDSSGFSLGKTDAAAPKPAALQEETPSSDEAVGLAPDVSNDPPLPAPRTSASAEKPEPSPKAASATSGRQSKPVSAPADEPEAKKVAQSRPSDRKQRDGVLPRIWGAFVSTPGAIYRQSIDQWQQGVNDMTNNSSNPCFIIPAAMVSLPFCAVAGVAGGIGEALRGDGDQSSPRASASASRANKKMADLPRRSALD